jgi:hypothetical protein
VDTAVARLERLVGDGRFRRLDAETVARLPARLAAPDMVHEATARARVAHGDLTAEQAFVADGGYRVVDWQRPVIAVPELDVVALLVDRGVPAQGHVDAIAIAVFWFVRLHWAVQAQFELFPAFRGRLFDDWAAEAARELLA